MLLQRRAPRRASSARIASSVGSSTFTSWKRRASAGSFSKYFLYSDHVVAAIVRSSPRASAGFSRLAASFCPACPPAPIIVCASSMNRMIGVGDDFTSSISPFSRFSNSPFTPAPACSSARSSVRTVTFFSTRRHVALRDAQREAFHHRRLADARFARRGSDCSGGGASEYRPPGGFRNRAPGPDRSCPFLAFSVRLTVNWSRLGVLPPGARDAVRRLRRRCRRRGLPPSSVRARTICSEILPQRVGLDLLQFLADVAHDPRKFLVGHQGQHGEAGAHLPAS